jgi:hypothetical protein
MTLYRVHLGQYGYTRYKYFVSSVLNQTLGTIVTLDTIFLMTIG